MNLKEFLPNVNSNQIIIYSFFFVLLQVIFISIQTNPTSLQYKNNLSAPKIFIFSIFIGLTVVILLKTISMSFTKFCSI